MPEATAIKQPPKIQEKEGRPDENGIVYRGQRETDFQKSVQDNLKQAGINHDPVPISQKELPIHVPTGNAKAIPVSEKEGYVAPPDTFQKPESSLLNHMIHGVDRTGEASEITKTISLRNDAAMRARNNPKQNKGWLDWFYDYKKTDPDSNIIQAADRFTKQNENEGKKAA